MVWFVLNLLSPLFVPNMVPKVITCCSHPINRPPRNPMAMSGLWVRRPWPPHPWIGKVSSWIIANIGPIKVSYSQLWVSRFLDSQFLGNKYICPESRDQTKHLTSFSSFGTRAPMFHSRTRFFIRFFIWLFNNLLIHVGSCMQSACSNLSTQTLWWQIVQLEKIGVVSFFNRRDEL